MVVLNVPDMVNVSDGKVACQCLFCCCNLWCLNSAQTSIVALWGLFYTLTVTKSWPTDLSCKFWCFWGPSKSCVVGIPSRSPLRCRLDWLQTACCCCNSFNSSIPLSLEHHLIILVIMSATPKVPPSSTMESDLSTGGASFEMHETLLHCFLPPHSCKMFRKSKT